MQSYNTEHGSSTKKVHPKSSGVSYVITLEGKTIYHGEYAWWGGFSKKESKKILEEIKTIDIGDGLLLLEREAEDFENSKVGEESLLLMSGCDQYVITYKYSMCPRFVNQEYLKKIYGEYGELHNPIIRNGRIIGRWYIKEGKIGYLLYEKIRDKTELDRKIGEMEEFIRE